MRPLKISREARRLVFRGLLPGGKLESGLMRRCWLSGVSSLMLISAMGWYWEEKGSLEFEISREMMFLS